MKILDLIKITTNTDVRIVENGNVIYEGELTTIPESLQIREIKEIIPIPMAETWCRLVISIEEIEEKNGIKILDVN